MKPTEPARPSSGERDRPGMGPRTRRRRGGVPRPEPEPQGPFSFPPEKPNGKRTNGEWERKWPVRPPIDAHPNRHYLGNLLRYTYHQIDPCHSHHVAICSCVFFSLPPSTRHHRSDTPLDLASRCGFAAACQPSTPQQQHERRGCEGLEGGGGRWLQENAALHLVVGYVLPMRNFVTGSVKVSHG